jgi:hypothetical protein
MRVEDNNQRPRIRLADDGGAVLWVERAGSGVIVRNLGDAVRNAKAQAEMPA